MYTGKEIEFKRALSHILEAIRYGDGDLPGVSTIFSVKITLFFR
jgi:hypothetical protein